jgi:hypothetical protein
MTFQKPLESSERIIADGSFVFVLAVGCTENMYEPKGEQVAGSQRKLFNEEIIIFLGTDYYDQIWENEMEWGIHGRG